MPEGRPAGDTCGRRALVLCHDVARKDDVQAVAPTPALGDDGARRRPPDLELLRELEPNRGLERREQRRRLHEVRDEAAREQIEQRILDLRMLLHHRVERALLDPERHERRLGPHVRLTLPFVEQRGLAEDVPLFQTDLAARPRHGDAGQPGDDRVEGERALVPHDDHRAGHELDELRSAREGDQRIARERCEEAERRHRRVGVVRGLLTRSRRLVIE